MEDDMKRSDFQIGQMIELYTDSEDKFGLGFVVYVDEADVILHGLTETGQDDGLTLYCIDEVLKLAYDTQYCAKLKRMMRQDFSSIEYRFAEGDLKQQLLRLAQSKNMIAEIQLLQSGSRDVMGLVSEVTQESCLIGQIDIYGQRDGFCRISTESISSIRVNSYEGRSLQLLMDGN